MNDMANTTAEVMCGWVSSPSGRGTLNIVWSCFLVLVTCTWTILHMNLPEVGESKWSRVRRKVRWLMWTIFAPEDVMLGAALQWQSAITSKKNMKHAGVSHWTTTHGFFADAGGFLLRSPDGFPTFPVNSRGLHYLVVHGYIEAPRITEAEIDDGSKSDALGKTIAWTQSIYLICQVIARAVRGLNITCLEVLTMAFLTCALPTYYFWLKKPLDREIPIYIDLNTSIADIVRQAKDTRPYQDTPLDFVEEPGWTTWRRRSRFKHTFGLSRRPICRIPNDYVVLPSFGLSVITWLLTVGHSAIHLFAWNSGLSSLVEVYLWRASALSLTAILFGWGLVAFMALMPSFDYTITLLGFWERQTTKTGKWSWWFAWALDGPALVSSVLYFIAKGFLICLSFSTLRWLPVSTFETIEWTDYIPHY